MTSVPEGEVDAAPADACVTSVEGDACACRANCDSLIAHWPLDEPSGTFASSASGFAGNGALKNFAGEAPWMQGVHTGALHFDGADDYVQVGAIAAEVKTLSLWLKPESKLIISDHTSLKLPTSFGPANEWTDPQNAFADDGEPATVASVIGTKQQHWGGFHLMQQLPRGAVILGITVTIDIGNLGLLGAFGVELSWDAGTSRTDSHYGWAQLIAGSDLRQAGGPDKLWGRTWTAEDFSDENFRVWGNFGGIANAMVLDFIGIEIRYAERTTPRTIFSLGPESIVRFTPNGMGVSGWPGSEVYVNGQPGGLLIEGWNHLAVLGDVGIRPSEVLFGRANTGYLEFPYHGLMDDVLLFGAALTPNQVAELYTSSNARF